MLLPSYISRPVVLSLHSTEASYLVVYLCRLIITTLFSQLGSILLAWYNIPPLPSKTLKSMRNKAKNSLLDKNAEGAIFPKENGWKQRSGGGEGSKDS